MYGCTLCFRNCPVGAIRRKENAALYRSSYVLSVVSALKNVSSKLSALTKQKNIENGYDKINNRQ
jgi:Fe-S-cluster-containing hydrogenase component 2